MLGEFIKLLQASVICKRRCGYRSKSLPTLRWKPGLYIIFDGLKHGLDHLFFCCRLKKEYKIFKLLVLCGEKIESEIEVPQLCLTLCDPMDCSLWGSSMHGIFQARLLEWVAISFSMGKKSCLKLNITVRTTAA